MLLWDRGACMFASFHSLGANARMTAMTVENWSTKETEARSSAVTTHYSVGFCCEDL